MRSMRGAQPPVQSGALRLESHRHRPEYFLQCHGRLKVSGLYFGAGKTLDAGNFWTGLIDDVRIYDRALSEEEVAVLAD